MRSYETIYYLSTNVSAAHVDQIFISILSAMGTRFPLSLVIQVVKGIHNSP